MGEQPCSPVARSQPHSLYALRCPMSLRLGTPGTGLYFGVAGGQVLPVACFGFDWRLRTTPWSVLSAEPEIARPLSLNAKPVTQSLWPLTVPSSYFLPLSSRPPASCR